MSQEQGSSEIKSTFDYFINEDTHLTKGEIDWEQKKTTWIKRLQQLHSHIQEMLEEYVEKVLLIFHLRKKR
ncbi:MAG: hypothetical protein ACERKK_07545 [Poseidonibacter sp.]|uniref:hypothetical protein n=1 Tax=Poseidonibacter sp. TaxID=2321188 RepID=UPI00359DBF31